MPYCPGISVQVTARKALIRRVKESVVLLRKEDARDGRPLLFRGVDTRGIVRARVQQEHRALRRALKRGDEPIKVEPDRFGVVIRIHALLDADILEDGEMIDCPGRGSLSIYLIKHHQALLLTPSRVAQVDHLLSGELIVSTKKKRSQVVRASPRDRLYTDDTFIGEGRGIVSQYQARRARYKFGETGDGEVLVIERRITEDDVRSLYDVMFAWAAGRVTSGITSHTFLTTGSTHGLLSSSR